MLSKNVRLNLKTNFRWVASGNSLQSQTFKLFYRQGENLEPRIGVSISSSQFNKANLRNRAKRKCFDAASALSHELPKDINLVIMPKAQVLEISQIDLEQELKDAISRFKFN